MVLKKSDLYSSLWKSCDEGGRLGLNSWLRSRTNASGGREGTQ